MNLKVLENDGTIISGTEGAIINKTLCSENGIVYDRLGRFSISSSTNSVTIQPGHLIIQGLNIILEEATTISISSTAQQTTLSLIVDIRATNNGITAELYASDSPQLEYTLTYAGEKVSGRYTYILGSITVGPSGVIASSISSKYARSCPKLYEHIVMIEEQVYEGSIELYIPFISTMTAEEIQDGFYLEDFLIGTFQFTGRVDVTEGIVNGSGIVEISAYNSLGGCLAWIIHSSGVHFSLDEGLEPVIISSRNIM